jgi:Rieske Fe-S protein
MSEIHRRQFLGVSAAGAVVTLTGGCGVFIGNKSTDAKVAPVAAAVRLSLAAYPVLAKAGGQILLEVAGEPTEVLVFKRPGGDIAAVSVECTHQGCDVDYVAATDRMECPCHGSKFQVTGEVVEGPAKRPLRRYSASVEGDELVISLAATAPG